MPLQKPGAPEQDGVSSEAIAPEAEAAEAEVVEMCEEPAGADAAPVDAVEESPAEEEEAPAEAEAVAVEAETVVETAQEAEEEPLRRT